ncbi:MAG: hypothetical protein PHF25_00295 [Candidatus Margulisbacteria bacterium]|nr:hypothetical protein [Candidatus Margulisiibacteriota bacterium]
MINDINFSSSQGAGFNINESSNDLLDGVAASIENSFPDTNISFDTNFCVDDSFNFLPEFGQETSDVEENPIVKEVFNSIRADHDIDLSLDPVVVDTLKALLYL